MAKKQAMPQKLNNVNTQLYYLDKMVTFANSVFQYEDAPESISPLWLNNKLLYQGSIAFFRDEVLDEVYALPYDVKGKRDLYGRPIRIQCRGKNGYHSDILKRDQFVIMYDNTAMIPLYPKIYQLAQRMAKKERTIDININQQKTPRILKTSNNKTLSVRKFLEEVEEFEDAIITYDQMDLDDLDAVLMPAPFVADKVQESKEATWREFCELVGISTVPIEKKERMISSEVIASQGGNYIGRYSRWMPRKRAIEEINRKFGLSIKLVCYDEMLQKEVFQPMEAGEEGLEV